MLPTIQVYDVVVNQRIDDPTKLQEGDIITFISQSKINYGETITHRIIKVTYEDGKYYSSISSTSHNLFITPAKQKLLKLKCLVCCLIIFMY